MVMHSQAGRTRVLGLGLAAAGLMGGIVFLMGPTRLPDPGNRAASGSGGPVVGNLPSRISESSGVAASRSQADILWTHNDQAGRPVLFAVSTAGRLEGSFTVRGAGAIDWEDIALGPCPRGVDAGAADCLYIGDIGDNAASRGELAIHVVPEPRLADADESGELQTVATVRFRYADGAADAEALGVTNDGDALVVTKGDGGPVRLYRVPAARFTSEGGSEQVATVSAETTLPIGVDRRSDWITGAAVSRDDRLLIVRSHEDVYAFDLGALDRPPRVCPVAAPQAQGEGVDFLPSGEIVLTTEARDGRAPIVVMACSWS